MLLTKHLIDLHLFDGGAPAGGDGGSGAEGGGFANSQGSEDLSKVSYGKEQGQASSQGQPSQGTQQAVSPTAEAQLEVDPTKEFEALVAKDGKYKQQFDARVQQILDRRFKDVNNLKKNLEDADTVLSPLMDIYGVNNLADLRQKVLMDNNRVDELADEAGMTKEQYLAYMETQRQNQAYQEAEQARQLQAQADALYQEWVEQGEALKEEFPDFNLERECDNPVFTALLQSSPDIDVRTAYLAIHHDEILQGVAQHVGEAVRTNTVDAIRARGMRPVENGLAEQAGVVRKTDVSKLTKEDRAEIVKRVQRGEEITF